MTKQIKIAFTLFLIQFYPIIARDKISNDLSAKSERLLMLHVGGREKSEYEHAHLHFPGANLTPKYGGYNGSIIPFRKGKGKKESEQNSKFKKQIAKRIFKKKKPQQKNKINGPKNVQNRHNPLLKMVKNGSLKLIKWKNKKFIKTKKQSNYRKQLTEKTEEKKNVEKKENENELEKIQITVDKAVEMIDQIQNIKKYTNYKKEDDKNGEENSDKNLHEKTENENFHKEIHHYLPFDVEYFLGNETKKDKKGSQQKKTEKSKSYFGLDLKMLKERTFYIDKIFVHSTVELFQHWGKHSAVRTMNVGDDIEEEEEEEGKNKAKHWSNKFIEVAKTIDKDCAKIGQRKGRGENALCILGRLFTICLTIQEEIKGIEEFDEKFQREIPEKLEWMRQGASNIFAYFAPKMDPKLEINKMIKKYNKLIQIKSEMRVDYDNFFFDNGPLKMREISEEDVEAKMDEKKVETQMDEKSVEKSSKNFEIPAQPFAYLASKKRRKQQISFYENQLEQLSTFLTKKPQ